MSASVARTVGVAGAVPGVLYVPGSPIVLINYEDLVNEADLSASLSTAYGPDGLGALVVSGVPDYVQLRATLLPLARKFSLLPDEVKAKYEQPENCYSFGWSHGKEWVQGVPDSAKGSYYANPLHDNPFPDSEMAKKYPSFCSPNIWPTQDMPEFEAAFKTLGRLIVHTGALLAKGCDKVVEQKDKNYKGKLHSVIANSRIAKARLLHYFPTTDSKSATAKGMDVDGSWCGWHNDHGSLTGLTSAMFFNEKGEEVPNPDPNSGLYIRSRLGETVRALIPLDCLAFQIGETQQVHSCGVLQATPHCVMAGTTPGISRETFAVFMEPEPLDPMSVPEGSDIEAVTVGASRFLPVGVPPLKTRWNNNQDFGEFTNSTLNAYHPYQKM